MAPGNERPGIYLSLFISWLPQDLSNSEEPSMSYTPAFDTLDTLPSLLGDSVSMPHRGSTLTAPEILRFGGLTFDPRTGAVNWCGKMLTLPAQEREALGVLMRRAGQILSRQTLASLLGVTVDRLDRRMQTLRHALKASGARCLPVPVEGLGYVLWRC